MNWCFWLITHWKFWSIKAVWLLITANTIPLNSTERSMKLNRLRFAHSNSKKKSFPTICLLTDGLSDVSLARRTRTRLMLLQRRLHGRRSRRGVLPRTSRTWCPDEHCGTLLVWRSVKGPLATPCSTSASTSPSETWTRPSRPLSSSRGKPAGRGQTCRMTRLSSVRQPVPAGATHSSKAEPGPLGQHCFCSLDTS